MDNNNNNNNNLQANSSSPSNVLNQGNFVFEEIADLNSKLLACQGIPQDLFDRVSQMVNRLNKMAQMGTYSAEFDTISKYIDIVVKIPWLKKTEDTLNLQQAKLILDNHHYGMDDVKEKILEYLASMILLKQRGENAVSKSPVLLLVGLQGVGKTTLAISVAEALGRQFVRVAMGAIGSTIEIRGRSKTFPESEPGQIIKALIQSGVKNPVMLLDEIEKSSGQEGIMTEIMGALLEILDPNQNSAYRDHYIDFPVDLSETLFICTANNTGRLSAALMDRMEVVKMPSYTDNEKIVIARDYVLPGVMKKTGLLPEELQIDPTIWPQIVRPFGYDTGIRSLSRTLENICRRIAKQIVEGSATSVYINADNIRKYVPQ